MNVVAAILCAVLLIAAIFTLIVAIPIGVGKLLFRWSGNRTRYIFKQSMSTIVAALVGSLVLTGIVLLVGVVFKQKWAFSGGLLIVYTFWVAIKAVRDSIRSSKRM